MNMKKKGGGGRTQKYLRKKCYHNIKFTVITPGHIYVEKTFEQWNSGYYNSQKTRRGVDGIGTQVISQTIDKCRIKMIKRELYNVKNPLWKGIGKILEKKITSLSTIVRKKDQST